MDHHRHRLAQATAWTSGSFGETTPHRGEYQVTVRKGRTMVTITGLRFADPDRALARVSATVRR